MDQTTGHCPHCGLSQPKDEQICSACGSALGAQIGKDTPLVPLPRPASLRRRRLIGGLVLGGVGLAGIGCGVTVLRVLGVLPSTPPVDTHRVLNLPLYHTSLEGKLNDYSWLPDNRSILGTDFRKLFLIDTKSGQRVWEHLRALPPATNISEKLLWSSDRRYIAEIGNVGSVPNDDFRAAVWDMQRRQVIWNSPPLGNIRNAFSSPYAFTPNGSSFALCRNDKSDNHVQIWDIQKNRLLKDWSVQDNSPGSKDQITDSEVIDMAWSPDNTRLALICRGGSIQVWHAAQGSLLWTYDDPNGWAASFQWSPDGTSLAVQLNQYKVPMYPLRVLDAHTGKLRFQTSWVFLYDMVWSSDGTRLALMVRENAGSTPVVQVWDVRAGQRLFTCQRVPGQLICLSWSPDGRYLAAGNSAGGSELFNTLGEDSTIQFWDAQSGKALFSYQAPRAPGQLLWSPDSRLLAAYNPQGYGQTMGFHVGYLNFALQVFQIA